MNATDLSSPIKTGTWTIQNTKTGDHRTFKVTGTRDRSKFKPGTRVVQVMTGTDNHGDFEGFGEVRGDAVDVWRSKRGDESKASPHEFFASMLAGLMGGRAWVRQGVASIDWAAKGYELRGEQRCLRCGDKLTTPESLDRGIGPVCAKKIGA